VDDELQREQAGGARATAEAVGLLLILVLIFVPSHFSRSPWNPDEPRYVEIAREMRLTGEYVLPHLNGAIYAEKPPLYFWLVAGVERAIRPAAASDADAFALAGRAVSALAVALTALWIALLGRILFDPRTGAIAAAIFITAILVVNLGQMGVIDPTFTCFTTLATLALVAYTGAERRGARAALGALAALAMGAGVLAKGPLGLVLPIAAASLLGLGARRGRAGVPIAPGAAGLAFGAAVGFGWLFLAQRAAGPDGAWYLRRMTIEQNLGRVVESWSHKHGFLYYLPQLAWGFFPWVLFLPAAIAGAVRAEAKQGRAVLLWAGALLLAFSAISGKRPGYILPLYPALALLVARRFAALDRGDERAGTLDRAARIAVGVAFLAAGVGLAIFPAVADRLSAVVPERSAPLVAEFVASLPPATGVLAVAIGALIAAMGLALVGAFAGAGARRTVGLTAFAIAIASVALHAIIVPAIDPQKSARALGERVARDHVRGERLVLYPQEFDGVVNFYTGALHYDVLETPDDLRRALAAPGRLWAVAVDYAYTALPLDLRGRFAVRGAYRVGSKVMYFLVEKEPAA
jgi:4-amino-4-deoxy-L-arabinose transferase-like glycosyltransferase